MNNENKTPDIIPLELPARDGSNGYSNLFLRFYNMLGSVAIDAQGNEAYRSNMLVDIMLNSIPDNNIRDDLKAMKKALKEERITQRHSKEERNEIIHEINMEVLGEVTGFFDLYLGTSKKIGVSIEAVYPEAYYKEGAPDA